MWQYNYNFPIVNNDCYDDELYHYGVPGMKWGHRKQPSAVTVARRDYHAAKKAYNKSFNRAYRDAQIHAISQYATYKGRRRSDAKWQDAYRKGATMYTAKNNYKIVKARNKSDSYKTMADKQANAAKNAKGLGKKVFESNANYWGKKASKQDYKINMLKNKNELRNKAQGEIDRQYANRKQRDDKIHSAKLEAKSAYKDYSKAFDEAYRYQNHHVITANLTKSGREKSNRLWNESESKHNVYEQKRKAYKQAKKR